MGLSFMVQGLRVGVQGYGSKLHGPRFEVWAYKFRGSWANRLERLDVRGCYIGVI